MSAHGGSDPDDRGAARGTSAVPLMHDVLVLCYHCFSPRWEHPMSVFPERFEEQLELVIERGYRGATFYEAVTAPPATRTVALTFDDAYRSILDVAVPVLRRRGLPGTIFTPTAFVTEGRLATWGDLHEVVGGPNEHELELLTWDELAALADEGWEIGAHTRTHADLPLADDATLAAELVDSRRECEDRIGKPCWSMAYPYGSLDARVVRAVEAAGYRAAAAVGTPVRGNPLEWPRVDVGNHDTIEGFRRKVSPLNRALARRPTGERFLRERRRVRLALARRVRLARALVLGERVRSPS
jgi:peptidoglycan/xylan/chitin deacetylase (PgdA/CDA1 family)